jgi:hypothetical protein
MVVSYFPSLREGPLDSLPSHQIGIADQEARRMSITIPRRRKWRSRQVRLGVIKQRCRSERDEFSRLWPRASPCDAPGSSSGSAVIASARSVLKINLTRCNCRGLHAVDDHVELEFVRERDRWPDEGVAGSLSSNMNCRAILMPVFAGRGIGPAGRDPVASRDGRFDASRRCQPGSRQFRRLRTDRFGPRFPASLTFGPPRSRPSSPAAGPL